MPRRRSERDRGAVVVEFALILPIFIALVFGIISYGYMLSYRQSLGQAASEGARAAAVATADKSVDDRRVSATDALNDALISYDVHCEALVLKRGTATVGSCSIEPTTPCPADRTRFCAIVTLTHAYRDHPLIPSFPGLGITLPQTLTYTAVMEVS